MGKKIKIIDILCYISIGDFDKVPKIIKYKDIILTYDEEEQDYLKYWGEGLFQRLFDKFLISDFINEEVEILEDKFEDIEEMDVALLGQCDNWLRCPTNEVTKQDIELNPYIINNIRENTLEFQHRINDLIKNQKKIIERLKDE